MRPARVLGFVDDRRAFEQNHLFKVENQFFASRIDQQAAFAVHAPQRSVHEIQPVANRRAGRWDAIFHVPHALLLKEPPHHSVVDTAAGGVPINNDSLRFGKPSHKLHAGFLRCHPAEDDFVEHPDPVSVRLRHNRGHRVHVQIERPDQRLPWIELLNLHVFRAVERVVSASGGDVQILS